MKVRSHKKEDNNYGDTWLTKIEDRWNYQDFVENEDWRKGWISFDCLFYDESVLKVFAGITSFDADIFWAFDVREKKSVSTGYERIADPFDAKFHRSIVKYNKDHCIYAAVALLHNVDNYMNAPGGAIVRYNPKTKELKKISVPFRHIYIQSLIIDQVRGVLYGQTFTPEKLFSYNLETGVVKDLGLIGSGIEMAQGENIILDTAGRLWGSWGATRAWQSSPGVDSMRLCCYEPEEDKIDFLNLGLPKIDGKHGFEKPEGFFNLGPGRIYVSGGNGSIYRVETEEKQIDYLGTPITNRRSRLASLTMSPDGKAYGVTGRDGRTELLCFDPSTDTYRLLGPVKDEDGIGPHQIHDIVCTPEGILYAGENDNPYRSGYLWEIDPRD